MKIKIKYWVNQFLFGVKPGYILSTVLMLAIFSSFYIPSLKFNYDLEQFFSSEDPAVKTYMDHKAVFGNENDFVLIGIRNEKGIFQEDFLNKLSMIDEALNQDSSILNVFSPTNLFEVVKGPVGSFKIPLIHVNNPDKYPGDKKKIYASEVYTNTFFSSDTLSVSILVKKESGLSKAQNDNLLHFINRIISSENFDEYHLAGRIQTQNYYVSRMKKQMTLFSLLAIILFLTSLYFVFRDLRYVMISFITVVISLILIFGFLGFAGINLDLMLTLVPTIIFVISTSSGIHLIERFKSKYNHEEEKLNVIKTVVFETGLPNFLNALTTAIGFASLVLIPVVPIQRFGLISAIGILLSFTVGIIVIPNLLRLLRIKPALKNPRKIFVNYNFYHILEKRYRLILGVFSFLIISAIYFASTVQINNHFLDDLSEKSSLKKDLNFFEDNFSGIRPFELNIQAINNKSMLDFESVKEMDRVENYIRNTYKANFILSPLTALKTINRSLHGGKREFYNIPVDEKQYDKILRISEKQKVRDKLLPMISDDQSVARISGRTKDIGSIRHRENNQALMEFLDNNTHYLKCKLTGAAHLIDEVNSHIARSLSLGVLLAVLVATIIIGLFTHSLKMALISLIPNLIPVLLAAGFMGLFNIPLKISTAIIFTITYGIAVDDTIHFVNNYRLNRKRFKDQNDVMRNTLSTMWKPMTITSIILFTGFMIFTLSEFTSISYLGLLVGGAILIALISDLILLPVLIKVFKPY